MGDDTLKRAAAEAALRFVPEGSVIGVGSGSTVNYFVAAMTRARTPIRGAVPASKATAELLSKAGIAIVDLNSMQQLPIYIDGADEINEQLEMIKGGGGSLTREKIIAAVAKTFLCIADESKWVASFGRAPLPVEVIPMAAEYVARQMKARGGEPVLRKDFITDNGNVILDIEGLPIFDPIALEEEINQIVGVVTCGIFARRHADILLLARQAGVEQHYSFNRS